MRFLKHHLEKGLQESNLHPGLLRAPSSIKNVAQCRPSRGGRYQDAKNMERGRSFWATAESRERQAASQEPVSGLGLGFHTQPPGLSVIPLQSFLIFFGHK